MILVRTIMQAKFGKGGELAAGMAESVRHGSVRAPGKVRILTDLSGEFDTVVMEATHESLAAWEQFRTALFASAEFQQASARGEGVIVSGRQEYYTIEAEI